MGAGGAARGMLKMLGPLALLAEAWTTSDADLEVLKRSYQMNNHRGAGFDDPRVLGKVGSVQSQGESERLARALESLANLQIHITTDSPAFSAEIVKDVARQSRRN